MRLAMSLENERAEHVIYCGSETIAVQAIIFILLSVFCAENGKINEIIPTRDCLQIDQNKDKQWQPLSSTDHF